MQNDRLSRREVLKFFAAVSATMAVGDFQAGAQAPGVAATVATKGYGTDPDLTKIYQRGDVWPLTFSAAEKKASAALADVILPADDLGPAATALRVPEFIDEWVSSPYPDQVAQRPTIIEGLAWLDSEAQKRSKKTFAELTDAEKTAICDDIAWAPDAKPEFKKAAEFFTAFRNLAAAAYYGTPEGWKAIGFEGNIPLPKFDGPPLEILAKLGLEQTVK